jgi:hypothetical protein
VAISANPALTTVVIGHVGPFVKARLLRLLLANAKRRAEADQVAVRVSD